MENDIMLSIFTASEREREREKERKKERSRIVGSTQRRALTSTHTHSLSQPNIAKVRPTDSYICVSVHGRIQSTVKYYLTNAAKKV